MDREKKITPITAQDIQDVINSSVMGAGNRLVGNATEQKQILVRPIANTDNKPNVMAFIQRMADEAEKAIEEVAEKSADISTEGLQPSIDEALETASKTIVGAINELRRQLAKATVLELTEVVSELPKVGEPNKFYLIAKETTDANDLYDEWIWVNKGTKDNPDYKWEYTGAKKIEFNAYDYVKKTDYANVGKLGVVKMAGDNYGIHVDADGLVSLATASAGQIIAKSPHKAVKLTQIDLATKVGVTTNTIPLTSDEKTSACEWLGAVPTQQNTDNTYRQVYILKQDGTNGIIRLANAIPYQAIPIGDYGGCTFTGDPTLDYHATNKLYVDQNKGTKLYLHEFDDVWNGNTLSIINNYPYEIEPHNIETAFRDNATIAAKINGRPCLDVFATGEGIKCYYLNEGLGITSVDLMISDDLHDNVIDL